MSFGGTSLPSVPAAPAPAPTPTSPSVEAAADALRQTQAEAQGRSSTILTSGTGVSMAPAVTRKTLLGQ
jgi:hypothetical protein